MAKTNDSSTWHIFQAVVDGKERGLFDAIGYIFSKDDPYTGIDFDDVRNPETGEILPWVSEEIREMGSYVEASLSGRGIHVITKAKLPTLPGDTGKKVPQPDRERFGDVIPKVEVYDERHFFITTGDRLPETPATLGDFQSGIDSFWKRFIDKPKSIPVVSNCNSNGNSDEPESKVVERARAYIAQIPGAVSGNFGHDKIFSTACVLCIGFGLCNDDALGLLEEWNVKCDPPWSDHELRHKIEDASKQSGPRNRLRYSDNNRGNRNRSNSGSGQPDIRQNSARTSAASSADDSTILSNGRLSSTKTTEGKLSITSNHIRSTILSNSFTASPAGYRIASGTNFSSRRATEKSSGSRVSTLSSHVYLRHSIAGSYSISRWVA